MMQIIYVPPAVKSVFLMGLLLLLSSCATWSPDYERPHLSVTSIDFAPDTQGGSPRFMIGVEVVNPNRQALALKGMSYALEIEGHRILSGAKPDLPVIEAFSTERFVIEASADLLGSTRLIAQLLSGQNRHLDYIFKARLDIGRRFPFLRIEEKGQLDLSPTTDKTIN